MNDNIITYPDDLAGTPLADVIAAAVSSQAGAVKAIQFAAVRILIAAMLSDTRGEALKAATDIMDELSGARCDALVLWFKKFGFSGDAKKGFTGYIPSDSERERLEAAKALVWHKAKAAGNPFSEYRLIDQVRAALKKGAAEAKKGNPDCDYNPDRAAKIEALLASFVVEDAMLEA